MTTKMDVTTSQPTVVATPEDHIDFDLTIDGDKIDPLEMVRNDGYDPKGWKFNGPKVEGVQTRTFQLLNLGYCANLNEAKQKADKQGFVLAEGQWRQAFREKFTKPTRGIAVIVAGSVWVDPDGYRGVPYLHGNGESWESRFVWSGRSFYGYCRWLGSRKIR